MVKSTVKSDVTSAVKNTKTVPVDSAPKDKAVQIAAAKISQPPKLLHAEAHAAPESKAAKGKAAIARLAVKKISGAAAKASPAETQHHAAATSHAEPAKPTAPVVAAAAHADKSTASKAVKSPAAPAAHASKPAAAAAKAPAHPHNAVAAKPAPPAHRVARGSPEWEREQEDSFFDHMGSDHDVDERRHLHAEVARRHQEHSSWEAKTDAEKKRAEEIYLAKKRRDAEQRLAAKKYTEQTFAAMNAHRVAIKQRSVDGFKSMEAKELATEVERENPHASAQVIAQKAMKLLHLVLKGRETELPSVSTVIPPP